MIGPRVSLADSTQRAERVSGFLVGVAAMRAAGSAHRRAHSQAWPSLRDHDAVVSLAGYCITDSPMIDGKCAYVLAVAS